MVHKYLVRTAATVAFALAAVLVPSMSRAAFYLDVENATTTNGDNAYVANIDSNNETVTLNVYAFITDPSPNGNTDLFKTCAATFFVAGSADLGDVQWASWDQNVDSRIAMKGTQYTTTYGGLGLGGTSSLDTSYSRCWYAPANGGGDYIGGPGTTNANAVQAPGTTPRSITVGNTTGYEYLLGTLTVTFSRNVSLTPANESFSALATNKVGASKPFFWLDNVTTSNGFTFGSASNVGNGAYNLLTSGGVLQFNISNYSLNLTNCHGYQPTAPTCTPIQRLERWDSGSQDWVPVMPGDLSSGNIHVLIHGWAPA